MELPAWLKFGCNLLIIFFFGAFAITVLVSSIIIFTYLLERTNGTWYETLFGIFLGMFGFLVVNACSFLPLVWYYTVHDDLADETRYFQTYSRKLSSGYLKETPSQTPSGMVVTLYKSGNLDKKSSNNAKYATKPEYPVWFGGQSRKTLSDSAFQPLRFNSFNFDTSGIIVSCDQFKVTQPLRTFANLDGIDEFQHTLVQFVITPFAEAELGQLDPTWSPVIPRGVLLTGAHGTGKSVVVEAAVNEIRQMIKKEVPFFRIDCANCFGSFIGSGATFRDIFHFAEACKPSILLFENIDALFDRSVTIFLTELSSVPQGSILVIATSSKKDRLHEDLLQPGKFDFSCEMPDLNNMAREAILQLHFTKRACFAVKSLVTELGSITENYTAAELENLVAIINNKLLERHCPRDEEFCELENTKCTKNPSSNNVKEVTRSRILWAFEKFAQERQQPRTSREPSTRLGVYQTTVDESRSLHTTQS